MARDRELPAGSGDTRTEARSVTTGTKPLAPLPAYLMGVAAGSAPDAAANGRVAASGMPQIPQKNIAKAAAQAEPRVFLIDRPEAPQPLILAGLLMP